MSQVKVGFAVVDFTPPVGLPLLGNLRSDYNSKGVHDPLMAKAIVFEDHAGTKAALLSLDLCMVTRDQVAMMREKIAEKCDIPSNHILIAATHIHSGPSTCQVYTMPKADDVDIEAFLTEACDAVVKANANTSQATFKIGQAEESRISFYRRIECTDGQCRMNWEAIAPEDEFGPYGKIDPEVIVLYVERDRRPTACVVNFGLHPAILDYENDLYSGEYPGVLAATMKKNIGKDFCTLFFNGCCGNINHIDHRDTIQPRRGYEMVEHVGRLLAESVGKAIRSSVDLQADIVKVTSRKVPLKRMPISKEIYEWSKEAFERLRAMPPKGFKDGLPREYSASTWIKMYETQYEDDFAEVMVIRLGELGIVGLPGEVFKEFGQQIKIHSPAKYTLVVELANDAIGYLPIPDAFEQGGYEVTPGATRYDKDAGQQLTDSALDLLNILFES